jgi:hypothetical protein
MDQPSSRSRGTMAGKPQIEADDQFSRNRDCYDLSAYCLQRQAAFQVLTSIHPLFSH